MNDNQPLDVVLPSSSTLNSTMSSTRIRQSPSFLQYYHCNLLVHIADISKFSSGPYSMDKYLSYDKLSRSNQMFACTISTAYEPSFYHQAAPFKHWRLAMDEEIAAMERTKTWSIVPLPQGHHSFGCKWVYRVKHKADGSVDRYKARRVAKGYSQQEGINFFDTFSPVTKVTTVKVFLSLATSFNWPVAQMDVNNAFLNGDLFEEVYMSLPVRYYKDHRSVDGIPHVCKLHKSLYGLK